MSLNLSSPLVRNLVAGSLLGLLPALLSVRAQGQAPGRPPAAVEVSTAQMKAMTPQIVATGQVQSKSGADMAAAIGGQLAFIAEPGTAVAKGTVIARIDVDEIRLQRAEQAARVTRGEVALRQAQREFERLKASGDAVSRVQLDQAENTRDLAEADLRIAKATLSQTDERISRSELRAPFAGVVAERRRRIGEEVARGDVLARLQDAGSAEIRLFLPLRHVAAITAGSEVRLRLGDGKATPAKVRAVVPVGDARSQSFEALIDVPTVTPAIAVGRSVQVEVPLGTPQQALAVPRDAVVIRQDGMAVFRIAADGKTVARVPVTTGVAEGEWVVIEGGLKAGEQVIVRGAESLRDGDAVQVVRMRDASSSLAAGPATQT